MVGTGQGLSTAMGISSWGFGGGCFSMGVMGLILSDLLVYVVIVVYAVRASRSTPAWSLVHAAVKSLSWRINLQGVPSHFHLAFRSLCGSLVL